MAKAKSPTTKNNTIGEPSSLYHYTNIDAFLGIFKNILENKDDNLIFYASGSSWLNDPLEEKIINEYFGSEDKAIVEQIRQNHPSIGNAYIISMSKCAYSRNPESLPMWNNYANNCNGIVLNFNYNELKKHFKPISSNNLNSIDDIHDTYILKCDYLSNTEIRKHKSELRLQLKGCAAQDFPSELKRCVIWASRVKTKQFEYENEYRIVKFCENSLYRSGVYGITPYNIIEIPIKCLSKIIIGANTYQTGMKRALDKIIKQCNLDISIEFSKIKIK